MRIEHSRKHGPFDPRYPALRHPPTSASPWQPGEERLAWQEFRARYFPDSRRHDLRALSTYESYLDDVEGGPADGSPAPTPGNASDTTHAVWPDTTRRRKDENEPLATPDTDRWESEGGASAGPRRRARHGERRVGTQNV